MKKIMTGIIICAMILTGSVNTVNAKSYSYSTTSTRMTYFRGETRLTLQWVNTEGQAIVHANQDVYEVCLTFKVGGTTKSVSCGVLREDHFMRLTKDVGYRQSKLYGSVRHD